MPFCPRFITDAKVAELSYTFRSGTPVTKPLWMAEDLAYGLWHWLTTADFGASPIDVSTQAVNDCWVHAVVDATASLRAVAELLEEAQAAGLRAEDYPTSIANITKYAAQAEEIARVMWQGVQNSYAGAKRAAEIAREEGADLDVAGAYWKRIGNVLKSIGPDASEIIREVAKEIGGAAGEGLNNLVKKSWPWGTLALTAAVVVGFVYVIRK